ncbi:response regulator [Arenibacter aquaticus]|uniref:histidine kinase n=1 Tax=Arenibacter aquaticus TaxID=2489054 RepID=A0A430K8Z1_9FLAO|nr:two-component regulator propeller domain-containing protein [Arenibacter aquaticus]RTE55462.1 response regulator [Arenibacter aquaticus]
MGNKKNCKQASLLLLLGIIIFSLSVPSCLYSQKFERFSNQQGFNQNTINSIAQDRYGFLWFGTPNGLIRHDGYEFITYTTQTAGNGSILSNDIKQLYNDKEGLLWIGTSLGLNVYVPSLEKFLTVPLDSRLSISGIGSGADGKIWFSGENKLYACQLTDVQNGVFQVSHNLLESYPEVPYLNDFSFRDKNSLLLATSKGLWDLSLGTELPGKHLEIKALTKFKALEEEVVTSLINRNNIYWIGTNKGLYKASLEGDKAHIITNFNTNNKFNPANSNIAVDVIFEDHNNSVWIGTTDNGLYKYLEEEDNFQHYAYDPRNSFGISSQNINALFQDDFNVLWVGTAQGGINKLDLTQKQFRNYSNNPYDPQSLTDNLLTAILEDSNGRLWLSGYTTPLFRSTTAVNAETSNSLKFENLDNRFPISDMDIVRSIYEDKKGYLWFGADQCLIVYNPKNDQFKKVELTKDGIPLLNNGIRSICQLTENEMLLLGSHLTVVRNPWSEIDSNKNPKLVVKSAMPMENEIGHTFLKSSDGSWWIGTKKGLIHAAYNGSEIKVLHTYTDSQEDKIRLSYENVFSLYEDNSDNIWVGTFGGGLNKMSLDSSGKPNKISFLRKNDVLPDDAIYGILPDGNNFLWLSSDMGLLRLHLRDNSIDVFDVYDGLPHNNFRQGAFYKGRSGYYYFGGLNGLTIFKPEEIKLNHQPPKVLITNLLINNERVQIGEKLNNKLILERSISETKGIAVSQKEQFIAFELAVEHTSTPAKNKVAYKLEGFNEDWVVVNEGKTTVTYTNLPARGYKFKVRAANGDGIWSTKTKTLDLKILPPWYRTWWSYLIFTLLTVSIGIGVVVYFSQHEKLKQRLKFEELDKERVRTINKGKFEYFTNMSHEFRTPLTLIAGPLERLLSRNTDPENNKYLAIIQKNTKRLLSLADQLISFQQAEQGRLKLNLRKETLGAFIAPTIETFENYAIEKDINFTHKVSSPDEEIIIDVEKTERIIFNLLSNSFKNTPPFGTIGIELKIEYTSGEKIILIDVVDSGKGIPEEDLENIFERFYQLGNRTNKVSGGGIGLSFCKSLVNLLNGEIAAQSTPGVETRFSVILPSQSLKTYNAQEIDISKKSFVDDWIPLSSKITDGNRAIAQDNGSKKKYSILLVENEVDVQTFLKGTLSDKYNIEVANNGIEGLEKIRNKEPDLVISDVMMPEMDGFEMCEKIKSDPELSHIHVLLLTALNENEDMIKGLQFGADEYLGKPFSLKHLELRVEKLIRTKERLREYFSRNSKLPKNASGISTRDKEFLSNIIAIMEKNISDSNFGVEELAKEIGLSTSHFYRRLKQLTGQSPNVYLRNFRLQRAAELLGDNEGLNVSEVMYKIGIESNSYFSTAFKKLHGVSPSEFIKIN